MCYKLFVYYLWKRVTKIINNRNTLPKGKSKNVSESLKQFFFFFLKMSTDLKSNRRWNWKLSHDVTPVLSLERGTTIKPWLVALTGEIRLQLIFNTHIPDHRRSKHSSIKCWRQPLSSSPVLLRKADLSLKLLDFNWYVNVLEYTPAHPSLNPRSRNGTESVAEVAFNEELHCQLPSEEKTTMKWQLSSVTMGGGVGGDLPHVPVVIHSDKSPALNHLLFLLVFSPYEQKPLSGIFGGIFVGLLLCVFLCRKTHWKKKAVGILFLCVKHRVVLFSNISKTNQAFKFKI